MSDVLVLYYSRHGATEALAREVCQGIDSVDSMAARLRTVPAVSSVVAASEDDQNGDLRRALGRYNGSLGKRKYPNKVIEKLTGKWFRV